MTDDRDVQVAWALQTLPVPDHRHGFWRDIETRLSTIDAPSAQAAPDASSLWAPGDDRESDLPIVAELADHRRHRSAAGLAAALILVVAVIVTLAIGKPSSEQVRIAGPGRPGQEVPPSNATTPTAVPVPTGPSASTTPEAALVDWLTAVGAGDTDTAAALTGPRSTAYVNALTGGAGLEGFLMEAGEGYGAWADSPDRSTTEVALDVDGEDITIVIVSGTWSGEGATGFRADAIPVVRSSDGTWLVEPWAIDPQNGGHLTVISPTAGEQGGFNGLSPDATLSAAAPGGGTFHFSLDDQPATKVAGEKASGGVRAAFDPPGAMTSQTHLLVIAYVDGLTVTAVAGTFTVEG